jgi:hypothetical protein
VSWLDLVSTMELSKASTGRDYVLPLSLPF